MKQKKSHPNAAIITGYKDLSKDTEKFLQSSFYKKKLEKANEILKKAPLPKLSK